MWLWLFKCGLRLCADSTTPSSCWPRGGAGKEGPVLLFLSSPFRLDSYSGRGLAGRTAAAGSRWNCWRSEECPAPLPSLVLCCRLCLTLAEDKTQAWKEVALHSPLSTGPAAPAGAAGAPTAAFWPSWCDHLACFARRARGPSWCHAYWLAGLRLSAGLMAHHTPLPAGSGQRYMICVTLFTHCASNVHGRIHGHARIARAAAQEMHVSRAILAWQWVFWLAQRATKSDISGHCLTTRLSLFCCIAASAAVTQAQTFTHFIFHSQASRREANLCFNDPNPI